MAAICRVDLMVNPSSSTQLYIKLCNYFSHAKIYKLESSTWVIFKVCLHMLKLQCKFFNYRIVNANDIFWVYGNFLGSLKFNTIISFPLKYIQLCSLLRELQSRFWKSLHWESVDVILFFQIFPEHKMSSEIIKKNISPN